MGEKFEFKIIHDDVRYLAQSTHPEKELPRDIKSKVRNILDGNGDQTFMTQSGDEYISVDYENIKEKYDGLSIGTVEYDEYKIHISVTVYDDILEEFGEKL